MIVDPICSAVVHHEDQTDVCDLQAGHDGPHSRTTDRTHVIWTEADRDGYFSVTSVAGSSEAEQRASYASIPVRKCIYCGNLEIVSTFIFIQPRGLKVAVPGRIGLCATCHRLLRDGDVDHLLERTHDTGLDDFPRDAVRALIRASRAAMPT